MPLPRDTAGRETRNPELLNTGLYSAGDYVVPRYGDGGRKEVPGQVLGDTQDIMGLAQKMITHAMMGGAELLPTNPSASVAVKKKGRKPTNSAVTYEPVVANEAVVPILRTDGFDPNVVKMGSTAPAPVDNTILQPCLPPTLRAQDPLPDPSIEVVFSTQLGKIRLNAVAVLDSTSALTLVFANESEIRYEPAPGTNVQLIVSGKVEDTMYPGFKFTWVDDKKVLMVFVKLSDED